jgi:methionyl-tRNA formyltransferase
LARQVRAFNPWPGTYFQWTDNPLKIHAAHPAEGAESPGVGVRTVHNGFPAVGTSQGILVLDTVQPQGKRPMPGDAFLRGARGWTSAR